MLRALKKIGYISIEAGDESFTDFAFVQVGDANTLRKMTLNEDTPKVYVLHDNADWAAVTIDETNGYIPVCFKAANDGNYTITVNTKDLMTNYLHLIDNLTGNDIDLMVTPSYTFSAKTTDYASRFRLMFDMTGIEEDNASTSSATFAYFNGSEWQIANEGNATLDIIDMTGRVVSTNAIEGNATMGTSNLSTGVYVMRLVNGENVKTQKIVVR